VAIPLSSNSFELCNTENVPLLLLLLVLLPTTPTYYYSRVGIDQDIIQQLIDTWPIHRALRLSNGGSHDKGSVTLIVVITKGRSHDAMGDAWR